MAATTHDTVKALYLNHLLYFTLLYFTLLYSLLYSTLLFTLLYFTLLYFTLLCFALLYLNNFLYFTYLLTYFATRIVQFLFYYVKKFKHLAFVCENSDRFMADLVGNPNCWFLLRRFLWLFHTREHLSRVMRIPDFCQCENKGADQLRSNCEADQRLCFRYSDSTIPLLFKSEISSF